MKLIITDTKKHNSPLGGKIYRNPKTILIVKESDFLNNKLNTNMLCGYMVDVAMIPIDESVFIKTDLYKVLVTQTKEFIYY